MIVGLLGWTNVCISREQIITFGAMKFSIGWPMGNNCSRLETYDTPIGNLAYL